MPKHDEIIQQQTTKKDRNWDRSLTHGNDGGNVSVYFPHP